ncbi:hypothetical protein [Methylobacterium sp. ap11]|uniref:hypothetical protein n=1 Tax=Methylobacterium sp. ap11 TaxID=1761799 RepID=UPI0011608EF8|nr:hypothetical protein [Methylobacterium sp. ap11]
MISGDIMVLESDQPGETIVLTALDPNNPRIPDLDELPRPHEKLGEPGVTSWGFKINPEDYEYRTHVVRPSERRHIKARNRAIIETLVLNMRPDLVDVRNSKGESLNDLCDWQVAFLHRHSKKFGPHHTRSFVFRQSAESVIGMLTDQLD